MTRIRNELSAVFLFFAAVLLIFLRFNEFGIDGDSALYASIARNFSENMDWLNLRINSNLSSTFITHPPLAIWLQGLLFKVFGATDSTARLLNSIFGVGIIFLIYKLGTVWLGQGYGLLASILTLWTQHFLIGSAFFCLDMSCAFFSLLGIYFFFQWMHTPTSGHLVLSSLSLSCALMSKGVFAFIPIGALGIFILFALAKWSYRFLGWGVLLSSFALPLTFFYFQSQYGDYPYLWDYIRTQLLSNQHHNPDHPIHFGIIPLFFTYLLPWSALMPFSLWTVSKELTSHRIFIYAYILIFFLFFSLSQNAFAQYLHLIIPINSLAVATLFWRFFKRRLSDKSFQLKLSQTVFGISVLLLFTAQILPTRVRLFSESDLFVVSQSVQDLKKFGINAIYCYSKGFGFWSITPRAQWYWNHPFKYHETLKQYNPISQEALLVRTDVVHQVKQTHPQIFAELDVYFQTQNLSFFIPKIITAQHPELVHVPIHIRQTIH